MERHNCGGSTSRRGRATCAARLPSTAASSSPTVVSRARRGRPREASPPNEHRGSLRSARTYVRPSLAHSTDLFTNEVPLCKVPVVVVVATDGVGSPTILNVWQYQMWLTRIRLLEQQLKGWQKVVVFLLQSQRNVNNEGNTDNGGGRERRRIRRGRGGGGGRRQSCSSAQSVPRHSAVCRSVGGVAAAAAAAAALIASTAAPSLQPPSTPSSAFSAATVAFLVNSMWMWARRRRLGGLGRVPGQAGMTLRERKGAGESEAKAVEERKKQREHTHARHDPSKDRQTRQTEVRTDGHGRMVDSAVRPRRNKLPFFSLLFLFHHRLSFPNALLKRIMRGS